MKHAHERHSMVGKKAHLIKEHKGWKVGTEGVVIDELNLQEAWFEVKDGGASFGAMRVPYEKLEKFPDNDGVEQITLRGVD